MSYIRYKTFASHPRSFYNVTITSHIHNLEQRASTMLESYRQHVAERAALGIPPLPLTAHQTADLIELLKAPPAGEEAVLVDLFTHRVPAGVDDAAKLKAPCLAASTMGKRTGPLMDARRAPRPAGTTLRRYNISPLSDPAVQPERAPVADEAPRKTLLGFYS